MRWMDKGKIFGLPLNIDVEKEKKSHVIQNPPLEPQPKKLCWTVLRSTEIEATGLSTIA